MYLARRAGEFLVARLGKDGRIERKMEFALLLEIVERAWSCPDAVVLLVLQAVKETVLKGGGVLFGAKRRRRGSSTRPTSTSKQGMGRTLAAAAVMPPGEDLDGVIEVGDGRVIEAPRRGDVPFDLAEDVLRG